MIKTQSLRKQSSNLNTLTEASPKRPEVTQALQPCQFFAGSLRKSKHTPALITKILSAASVEFDT